jgi:hypothetical protein
MTVHNNSNNSVQGPRYHWNEEKRTKSWAASSGATSSYRFPKDAFQNRFRNWSVHRSADDHLDTSDLQVGLLLGGTGEIWPGSVVGGTVGVGIAIDRQICLFYGYFQVYGAHDGKFFRCCFGPPDVRTFGSAVRLAKRLIRHRYCNFSTSLTFPR